MDKFELLEAYCMRQLKDPDAAQPVTISWEDQSRRLYDEGLRFAPWRDVAYDAAAEGRADEAILQRVRSGRWPKVAPRVGRVIGSRLIQAVAVIMTNELANPRTGTKLPSGLSSEALTSALLIYWCYAMELVLPETGGVEAGRA